MRRSKYYLSMIGLGAVLALSPAVEGSAMQAVSAGRQESAIPASPDGLWGQQNTAPDTASLPGTLMEGAGETLQNLDKDSLRRKIRKTLNQMDEMGISPSAIAENVLGVQTTDPARSVETFGSELIREAQHEVTKRSEGFLSMLWEGFLSTLGSLFSTVFSLFHTDSILPK